MRAPVLMMMGLVGCTALGEPASSTVGDELGGCEDKPFLCNNSPGYLHEGLHELSLLNVPNRRGIAIARWNGLPLLIKDGEKFQLDVRDGEIRGRSWSTGTSIAGDAVVGANIPLVDSHNQPFYEILVRHHRLTTYPLPPKTPLHAYELEWHPHDVPPNGRNACNAYKFPKRFDFDGLVDGEALLFAGDRITPENFSVSANANEGVGWITFGCAGHALAKLDLSNNTRHRQPVSTYDWAGSQATLKLYAADYCGRGPAFTVPHTPLVWRGAGGEYEATPVDLEARWTALGASCLARPRMIAHPSPVFGDDILEQIDHACAAPIPACTNLVVDDLDGAVRITGNL